MKSFENTNKKMHFHDPKMDLETLVSSVKEKWGENVNLSDVEITTSTDDDFTTIILTKK